MSDTTSQPGTRQTKDVMQYLADVDKFFQDAYVTKAPFSIPDNWKEIIVKVSPYLNVIGIVFSILALPVLLGGSALMAGLGVVSGAALNPMNNVAGIVALVFTLANLVLMVMAAQGLFKRKASAWKLVFYSMLLTALQSAIALNIVNVAFTLIVGMYVLYQVKEKYTN